MHGFLQENIQRAKQAPLPTEKRQMINGYFRSKDLFFFCFYYLYYFQILSHTLIYFFLALVFRTIAQTCRRRRHDSRCHLLGDASVSRATRGSLVHGSSSKDSIVWCLSLIVMSNSASSENLITCAKLYFLTSII